MDNKRISREFLSNPFLNSDYEERLEKSKAIDLRDNSITTELENDYIVIEAIDNHKLFKKGEKKE